MALNASQVRTAPSGHVYVGPLGTTEPDDATSPLDAALRELGYLTPDGVSITPSVETENINVWQSLMPVLTPITGMSLEISFTLAQMNMDGLSLFFNGSEFDNDNGVGRLEIESNPGSQERLLVVDWVDNIGDAYRLVVPRAQMTNREALSLTRGDSINQGLTFSALDDDGIAAYLLTNNADLVPVS
jgi:hypothetical protein